MPDTTKDDDVRQTKPFADVLQTLQRGKTHRELSAELQRLTEAVVTTNRKGTLTFTLTLDRNKAGMIEVTDRITTKMPQPDRTTSLFYATEEANLVRDDPRQQELFGPVRVADAPPAGGSEQVAR